VAGALVNCSQPLACFICEACLRRAELRAEFPTVGASCLSDVLEASLRESAAYPPYACHFCAGAASGDEIEDCGLLEENEGVTGGAGAGVVLLRLGSYPPYGCHVLEGAMVISGDWVLSVCTFCLRIARIGVFMSDLVPVLTKASARVITPVGSSLLPAIMDTGGLLTPV
jgi:hypothetical protein